MPLIDQVATALRRAGLRSFSPAAFKPHMTLIYRGWWMPVEVLDRPIAWTVRDLLLVNSIFGQTTHEHLAEWSLQA
jgi:2'-5' RNA ligase